MPFGSLLSIASVRCCEYAVQYGRTGVACLWSAVVEEIGWHCENGVVVPGVPVAGGPTAAAEVMSAAASASSTTSPSLHALLLLTQSLPPPLARHLPHGNPFLAALCAVGDEQSASSTDADDDDDAEGGGAADPEQGRVRASQLAFRSLHDAIAAALPAEGAVLLLYLLLHGNADFRDYALSRTDADTLLLPLVLPAIGGAARGAPGLGGGSPGGSKDHRVHGGLVFFSSAIPTTKA